MRRILSNFYIISTLIFISLLYPFFVFGQTVTSNCVVTKVGIPTDPQPSLPPECQTQAGANGVLTPPNLECIANGYCKMPAPTDGSYVLASPESERWGTKELVQVLYTVAKEWKKEYPNGYLIISDLTALTGHDSHKSGVDVDMDATTDGTRWAADFSDMSVYDQEATVKLGKMFAKTGFIKVIFYNDEEVNSRVLDFSPGSNPSEGMEMYYWPNHHHHFHVRVNVAELCRIGPYNC